MNTQFHIKIPQVFNTVYNDWPPVGPTLSEIDVMMRWCRDNVGDQQWHYNAPYRKVPCIFSFKNEEDLLAFRLRFGI